MAIAFISHPDCELHDTGVGHPESPARMRAVLDYLPTREIWQRLTQYEAPLASREQLYRVHDKGYVDAVIAAEPTEGRVYLDPDTSMAPHSLNAALRAAGSVVKAVDLVMSGDTDQAFCCVRPCGHHAEIARPMGFCIFNNVAVGARYAQGQYGLGKVAIVDFDVHHGNGTEDIFRVDNSVFFSSTFQHPFYPGSGADTRSDHIVNIPLPAGTRGDRFRAAFEDRILPALNSFEPELLFISAGFDAHEDDPLAQLCLLEEDFAWATRKIRDVAKAHCKGRLVSVLEGGYSLTALARSVEAHLQAML
ncbi:MAG TPA: histone deacetylase family protein [Gammaproteobacteria bacterium]|nr:histone deacetylase family protein [Gammaproteobacteria bacterium]